MTIRVLYTDVDGTLVGPLGNLFWSGERTPTLEAAEALVAARAGGLEIVPVSGRSVPSMIELARLIGVETWIGELGAVRSYDRGNDVVYDFGAYSGSGSLLDELRDAADRLVAANAGRLEEHAPWNAWRETSLMLRGAVDLDVVHACLKAEGFDWMECLDNGVIPRSFDTLPGVQPVRIYHLNPKGVSKHAAIAADRARRGLGREECAVIGDAVSDVACHAEVARTFVVANALEKDPLVDDLVQTIPTAEVTKRSHGQGFADVVSELIGDR